MKRPGIQMTVHHPDYQSHQIIRRQPLSHIRRE